MGVGRSERWGAHSKVFPPMHVPTPPCKGGSAVRGPPNTQQLVWVHITAPTLCQGLRKGTDNKVLKEKLSLNCKGPFKGSCVRFSSAADTSDGPNQVTIGDVSTLHKL